MSFAGRSGPHWLCPDLRRLWFTYSAPVRRHALSARSAIRGSGLPRNGGVGEARNAGVAETRGDWIALLDDDEWLEGKLAAQLAVARGSRYTCPIVSCRFVARTKHGDVVLRRRTPGSGETVSEYLFCQKRLLGGEGLILPSTMLAPRELVVVSLSVSAARGKRLGPALEEAGIIFIGTDTAGGPGVRLKEARADD